MREIEVKARLQNKENLLLKAKELGIEFGPVIAQDDTTYETTTPKDNPNWNIFRIRKEDGISILTMKYKASTRRRDNHERESVIDNAKDVADMLERVGYHKGVRIRKTRQIANLNDIEICLDEVERLGSFIEIEKIAPDDANVDDVQNSLWAMLEQLGINPEDRVFKGYDSLMRELVDAENQ